MNNIKLAFILAASSLALAASPNLMAKDIHIENSDNVQTALQEALILAEEGDVVHLAAGRYILSDGLSLDVDGVTIKGDGKNETILDFTGQQGAGEGLLVTSSNVTLRDFSVENTKGDGIKSKQAHNIIYYNLRVEWTGGPKSTNGAYGIYPVESENVLIDNVEVIGASDAGIYVGQSRNIIVRYSQARYNVAGIEIENSFDADVYGNFAAHNTGGILVFDLPDLPQQGGHNIRLYNNVVTSNDTPNFAPEGNIVASVPMGTGIMVMANNNVEIFDNILAHNSSSNVMIVSYPMPFDDDNYQPTPRNISLFNNLHGGAGYAPDFDGGAMLAGAFGGAIPAIIWDGIGGDDAGIASYDNQPVLSLGLTEQGQPLTDAKPSVLQPSAGVGSGKLPAITLPKGRDAVR